MKGLVTEKHWQDIETTFPGIHQFYDNMDYPPKTFLELWEAFVHARQITHQTTISPLEKKAYS